MWKVDHIGQSKYTRPGFPLDSVTYIVWHYTANPSGAGDEGHQRYFDNLENRYASAHIFIDKDSATEIIPLNEVAYHAGNAWYNRNSIGIELCNEADGTFHPDTIHRAVQIGATLAEKFELNPVQRFVRHYDVTGKICPKPWVDNPQLFIDFKQNVKRLLEEKQPHRISEEDAKKIIRFLQAGWYIVEGNSEAQQEFHRLANEIRKVGGLYEQKG